MTGVKSLAPGETLPIDASDDEPTVLEVHSGTALIVDEMTTQSVLNAGQSTTVSVPVTLSAAGGDAMVEVRPAGPDDDEDEED